MCKCVLLPPGDNPIAVKKYIISYQKPSGFSAAPCIKLDLQEVGCGDMEWFDLAEDRDRWRVLVNAAMNLRVP